MGFSGEVYWSGSPGSSSGDLPDSGMEPSSLVSPALAGGFFFCFLFTTSTTWEAQWTERDIASWPLVHNPLPSRRTPERSWVSLSKNAWEFPLLSPEYSYAQSAALPARLLSLISALVLSSFPYPLLIYYITYLIIMLIVYYLSSLTGMSVPGGQKSVSFTCVARS